MENNFEETLGYTFTDASYLRLALTHPSYGAPHNQRLEFLGDAVLQLCTSELLYQAHPHYAEGELTRLRALLVQERSLSTVAVKLGVGEHLLLGKGELIAGGRHRASILADTVEAILGAVYLDGGFEAANAFVKKALSLVEPHDWRDFKTELQEATQAHGRGMPSYYVIAQKGPAHDVEFTIGVQVAGCEVGRGTGSSKKTAEQAAAYQALKHEGYLKETTPLGKL